jgi:hypothetical protein
MGTGSIRDGLALLVAGDEAMARRVLLSWSLRSVALYEQINFAAWMEQEESSEPNRFPGVRGPRTETGARSATCDPNSAKLTRHQARLESEASPRTRFR